MMMIQMSRPPVKKMIWSKLRLPFGNRGKHAKEDVNDSTRKSNLTQEYKEAFRTKSYIEMCNKVQCKTEIGTSTCLDRQSSISSSSSTPLPSWDDIHLPKHLLEPKQEIPTSTVENSSLHQYIVDYFAISLEACEICETLLMNVHGVQINYHPIKSLTKFIKQQPSSTRWSDNRYQAVYNKLASFVFHKNPFATVTPEKFHKLHDSHVLLLHELTSQCQKTKRRTKFTRWIKIIFVTLVPFVTKTKSAKRELRKICGHQDFGETLDIVARGVYILINDFDTMSRLVQRLSDEVERKTFLADICVKRKNHEMVKEVVKEFQMHESCFLEQLEELEKQIYLCFLDINRSRRLVEREMTNS